MCVLPDRHNEVSEPGTKNITIDHRARKDNNVA